MLVILSFSACHKEPKLFETKLCTQLELIEIAESIEIELTKLGRTTLHNDDRNSSSSDVYLNMKKDKFGDANEFAITQAVVLHQDFVELLIERIYKMSKREVANNIAVELQNAKR